MKKDDFDRTFDSLLVGVLDGATGGKVSRVRRFARDVVTPATNLRPYAAATLREIADRLDPQPARRCTRRKKKSD